MCVNISRYERNLSCDWIDANGKHCRRIAYTWKSKTESRLERYIHKRGIDTRDVKWEERNTKYESWIIKRDSSKKKRIYKSSSEEEETDINYKVYCWEEVISVNAYLYNKNTTAHALQARLHPKRRREEWLISLLHHRS